MPNIYEITKQLIQRRGEVKAAIVMADKDKWTVRTIDNEFHLGLMLDGLQITDAPNFTGTIWFTSGSYAYLDKDGAGYYWCFVPVPEIPKELC